MNGSFFGFFKAGYKSVSAENILHRGFILLKTRKGKKGKGGYKPHTVCIISYTRVLRYSVFNRKKVILAGPKTWGMFVEFYIPEMAAGNLFSFFTPQLAEYIGH